MSQDGDELALAIEYSHVLADDDDADDAMLQAMWASLRERRASRGADGVGPGTPTPSRASAEPQTMRSGSKRSAKSGAARAVVIDLQDDAAGAASPAAGSSVALAIDLDDEELTVDAARELNGARPLFLVKERIAT